MSTTPSLQQLQDQLTHSFEKENWQEFGIALGEAARVGEKHARIELSLRAQSLQAALGSRSKADAGLTFSELTDHFEELLAQVAHLSWAHEGTV